MRSPRFQRNPLFVNHVQDLVTALIQQALAQEKVACEEQLKKLVEDNNNLGGDAAGFLYNGDILSPYQASVWRGRSILPVDQQLEDRAEAYVTRKSKLDKDQQRIEAGFSVVTSKCRTTQDIRDTLPDTLAALVPAIGELPRTREEDFLFQNNALLKKQFRDITDLLFDYQFKHQMDALVGVQPE